MLNIATTLAGAGAEAIPPGSRPLREPRPMADINAAMRDLDINDDAVLALLDKGALVGFNIAVSAGGRRVVRILTASVQNHLNGGKPGSLSFDDVLRLVLPGELLFVRGMAIERCLNCCQTHVSNLIKAGAFDCTRPGRRGHGNSSIVTRASVVAWLKARVL
jgi:hypothetical protein